MIGLLRESLKLSVIAIMLDYLCWPMVNYCRPRVEKPWDRPKDRFESWRFKVVLPQWCVHPNHNTNSFSNCVL